MPISSRAPEATADQGLVTALRTTTAALGAARVRTTDPARPAPLPRTPNVSMFRSRDIYGEIRPNSPAEVRDIVRAFADSGATTGLHVVSTGRNWGLGSREPAGDAAVTVDLGGLDRIRDLDLPEGWAVVEPGVTQLELARRLAGTERMLNVTASSGHTSVLGNMVDRGVGLRRQRTHDLLGLEVVLPDGELVHVGWWPREDRPTAPNPHGLGPSPLHLFTQSDLGIVTAAVVRLLPRPEAQYVLRLSFASHRVAEAVDTMRRWVAQGLVSGVLKIYDEVATLSYGGRPGENMVHLCVDGTAASARMLADVIVQEADASGLFTSVSRNDQDPAGPDDAVARAVESLYAGDPSHNEDMLRSAVGQEADLVDAEGGGWLFFLPLIPFSGRSVARAHELLDRIHTETGVRAGSTVNALDADVIDYVVSIRFSRTPQETERAHHALDRAYELFAEEGFIPYRLDADHQDWAARLARDSGPADLVRRLKSLIDPRGVIAPGRYSV